MGTKKLKYAEYMNGKFAICPRCNQAMAKNVCGYWQCIFGCDLIVDE